jgi:hypothetical protein
MASKKVIKIIRVALFESDKEGIGVLCGHHSLHIYVQYRVRTTGRQPPPLSSVLYGIIYKRCSVVAAQVLLREKSDA